jgi:ubiquinol oxidase
MSTLPEKNDHQSEENKNDRINNNAVVSSYWGIARPKILKEDGTEWPWNCFMVRILILI